MKLGGFIEQFGKAEWQAQRGLLKIARLLSRRDSQRRVTPLPWQELPRGK